MDDGERTIRRLRIDARERQEEAEAMVAELALATRSLRDAVLDHARRGASIRIEVASGTLAGTVVHVGAELVRLVDVERQAFDVVLSAVSGVRVEAGEGAASPVTTGYPETLLARCRELVQANAEVEIGRWGPSVLRGRMAAATATHLELHDGAGGGWIVPSGAVCWVRRTAA